MIVLDTSVLIRYLRTKSSAIREVFASADCGVSGVTRAEILHGARTREDADNLRAALNAFMSVVTPEIIWDRLGDYLAALRGAGLPIPFRMCPSLQSPWNMTRSFGRTMRTSS